jgi:hypothetical protein
MPDPLEVNPMLTEGYSGLRVDAQARVDTGPKQGTIAWRLEKVERHAAAEAGSLPTSTPPATPHQKDLGAVAKDLVAEERSGAHTMRDLAMDSEKHAHLLEFVHNRLARRTS